jgi:hypothetical protein
VCSDRRTQQAEDIITTQAFREITFEQMFSPHEDGYDAMVIDVAPSLTLFQTCAMVYTKQVCPCRYGTPSVHGAAASMQAGQSLNSLFKRKPDICVVGILPVMVDRRLNVTDIVMNTLGELSRRDAVPILPAIRTDKSVVKAGRHKQFLVDFDPKSKALEDYTKATDELLHLLRSATVSTEVSLTKHGRNMGSKLNCLYPVETIDGGLWSRVQPPEPIPHDPVCRGLAGSGPGYTSRPAPRLEPFQGDSLPRNRIGKAILCRNVPPGTLERPHASGSSPWHDVRAHRDLTTARSDNPTGRATAP